MGKKIKTAEAAKIVGISRGTMLLWEKNGKLEGLKYERNPVTNYRIFDEDEVIEFAKSVKKYEY